MSVKKRIGPVSKAIKELRDRQRVAALCDLSHQITAASDLVFRAMLDASDFLCIGSAEATTAVLTEIHTANVRIASLVETLERNSKRFNDDGVPIH